MKRTSRENAQGLAVVLPIVLYFCIFNIVPLFMLIYYSFTDLSLIYGTESFVGFRNYVNVFKYPEYIQSFLTTILIALFLMATGLLTGFLFAVLINSLSRLQSFFRTVFYIPTLVSIVVVSEIINMMLSPEGAANQIVQLFGGQPVKWHDSTFWMYAAIIALMTWRGMGGTILLFIAALNGISKDVYEAAEIDGANKFRQMISITMPLIRPMFGFILITGSIGAFNIFEPVKFISGGGPDGSTKVILFRIYDEAFNNFKQGFASALSVMVLVVVMLLTFLNAKVSDNSIFSTAKKTA